MRFSHPFEGIPSGGQKRALLVLIPLTLFLMAVLNVLDVPLKTDAAPFGIVSFEFVKDVSTAERILGSWDQIAQIHAGLSLGLDYLFLVVYSTTIALACVRVTTALPRRWRSLSHVGLGLAWGQWLAATLDAAENYALIMMLLGAREGWWPATAWWCAAAKFAIVASGLAYILIGAVSSMFGSAASTHSGDKEQ